MENFPNRDHEAPEHTSPQIDDWIYLPSKVIAPTPLDTRFEGGPEQQPRDFDIYTMIY